MHLYLFLLNLTCMEEKSPLNTNIKLLLLFKSRVNRDLPNLSILYFLHQDQNTRKQISMLKYDFLWLSLFILLILFYLSKISILNPFQKLSLKIFMKLMDIFLQFLSKIWSFINLDFSLYFTSWMHGPDLPLQIIH